ncbi:CYTH domain-containing protein [Pseudoponticoccus marisrubri]|uniref:Adenylate cyclase n=1 Tax=Pseudoponticoccus marisrubri TaxID=1685382 RepID=A0A0W7WE13_9RHOB|nr:CYTH domain-containing protein [Pseudoponticoccus marisrubri]KUF08865.1 adenylate cyclase [Pseudoponticoccus marisrubri]
MSVEIERKFLVTALPDLDTTEAREIRQGYLTRPGDSVEMRLRQKGARFYLTLKGGSGLLRSERESEIDAALFETFWPATEGQRIEKTRHEGRLPCGTVFELDLFAGRHAPFRLVEVEFDDAAAAKAFIPPDWFGREVTGETAYGNKVMAFDGVPA